jgi:hypothetical protein
MLVVIEGKNNETGTNVSKEAIAAELDQLSEDILYTEKSFFSAADEWSMLHNVVGGLTSVSAAASALAVIKDAQPVVAVVLAVIAAVGGALQTFVKFGDWRDTALKAGRELNSLRVQIRQARNLRLPDADGETLDELVELTGELARQKAKIDAQSPISRPRHYERAKKKIKAGEFDRDGGSTA